MREKIKSINWKQVKINSIKIVFIFILNTPLWVYLIGNLVPYGEIGEFKISWIDFLRLSKNVKWYHIWLLYLAIVLGIFLTILFIKYWISATKHNKERQESLNLQKENTAKIVEAITKEKQRKEEKAIRDVEKYL